MKWQAAFYLGYLANNYTAASLFQILLRFWGWKIVY